MMPSLRPEVALFDPVRTATSGRKLGSASGVGRATTAARGMGRAARERGDIARAREDLESLQEQLEALEEDFEGELSEVRDQVDADSIDFDEVVVRPRKTDLSVDRLSLVWLPYRVGADGIAQPAFET